MRQKKKMPYKIRQAKQFKKDLKRILHNTKLLGELNNVISKLKNGEVLPPKYKNHELKGNLSGRYECHISPDTLLMYRYVENELLLVLLRVGSHSELF